MHLLLFRQPFLPLRGGGGLGAGHPLLLRLPPTNPTCPMPSRRHLLIVYSHLLTLICDLTFDNRFSRMLWLKRMDEPGEYKAIVPGLGHFHSAIHMLMAIHKLWCVTACRILGLYRFDLLSLFKNTDFSICDQVECSCQSPA